MASAPSSTFSIEPATLEDIPAITQLWMNAFATPEDRKMFPDTPSVRKWWDDTNRHDFLNRPYQRYMIVVDRSSAAREIIAYAKWDLASVEERGIRFPPWHQDSDAEMCDAFIGKLEENRNATMGKTKHYYLDMLATHPNYQRKGLGSMLVQWGCNLADQDGVILYVDASKDGAPLYEKFGFVDKTPPTPEPEPYAAMVRQPVVKN